MELKVVNVIEYKERTVDIYDSGATCTQTNLELFNNNLNKESLKDFLISLYNLPNDSGLANNRGMFNSKDVLSYDFNDDCRSGFYTIRFKGEIIEGDFKLIKALNIDGKYYKLEELNI